jgi:hypothetical protein
MPREFKVEKLSDEFGQYVLILKCGSCLRELRTTPNRIAHICGWDARLADVARRMRCSTCGAKNCTARAVPGHGAAGILRVTDLLHKCALSLRA